MSSEFLRLYRELDKVTLESKPPDLLFKKERKEVLKALGYDIKGLLPRIKPPKHHGKVARRLAPEKYLSAMSENYKEFCHKKKELGDVVIESEKINVAAKKMANHIKSKSRIPRGLWTQLAPLHSGDLDTSDLEKSACKPLILSEPSIPRERSYIDKTFTTNLWSKEERDRLNRLYREVPVPPAPKIDMWIIYYETLANRFQGFFPGRKIDEIVDKIEEMIVRRAMKEPGEIVYWRTIKETRNKT